MEFAVNLVIWCYISAFLIDFQLSWLSNTFHLVCPLINLLVYGNRSRRNEASSRRDEESRSSISVKLVAWSGKEQLNASVWLLGTSHCLWMAFESSGGITQLKHLLVKNFYLGEDLKSIYGSIFSWTTWWMFWFMQVNLGMKLFSLMLEAYFVSHRRCTFFM